AVDLRLCGAFFCLSMKSLKNCSNGEPGGSCRSGGSPSPSALALMVWLVEIFTTAGCSFSARSAKLNGAPRTSAAAARISADWAGDARSRAAPKRGVNRNMGTNRNVFIARPRSSGEQGDKERYFWRRFLRLLWHAYGEFTMPGRGGLRPL